MTKTEEIINKIAQSKIDFNLGLQLLLNDDFKFEELFRTLHIYIFNSIPEKTDYNPESYQLAIKQFR